MQGKVAVVPLVVSDQARALEFYTEKVGFEKKTDVGGPEGDRFVTVGPKGQELEISLWQVGSATDPAERERSKQWAPSRVPPFVIRVEDCKLTHEQLSSRGVAFTRLPTEQPWGIVATFQDPDGNLFSISQFRAWRPK